MLIYDWKDHLSGKTIEENCMFQSLFCHWCQTCYMLVSQLLIYFKYYHLVDWWGGFDQQDVTKVPRGKVELWLCIEVQGSIKTVMTQCVDNYLRLQNDWLNLESLEE